MSRTFFRKFFPAVPRAAGRPALRASALRGGEFGIIRAPGAARAGNPPAHRMPTTPARRSGRMAGGSGGRATSAGRFAPPRMQGRPGALAREAPNPPGRPTQPHASSFLYIGRKIGHAFGPGVFRDAMQAAPPPSLAFPCSLPSSFSRRRFPPERRTAASGPARLSRGQSPRRPSLVDYLCRRVSIISILKKPRCDRLFECSSISTASDPTHVCRTALGLVLKTKKKRAADAALFLNRYIWRQSYASLKNFFLPT